MIKQAVKMDALYTLIAAEKANGKTVAVSRFSTGRDTKKLFVAMSDYLLRPAIIGMLYEKYPIVHWFEGENNLEIMAFFDGETYYYVDTF